jgi:hypothetical protein
MNPINQLQDIQDTINTLKSRLTDLEASFYKNNFSSSQTFNKDCVFNSRLRVPVYDSLPTVGQVGDIVSVTDVRGDGQLYICTLSGDITSNAGFEKVGAQIE